MKAISSAVVAFALSATAFAQTPGIGETRPADPAARERAAPADDAVKGTREPAMEEEKARTDSDRTLMRCERLTGAQRDDCLREERAAAGGTRPAEPATAPPPQNPR
jgi:hypothetical protein